MDIFVEQIVKKRSYPKDWLISVGIALLTLLLCYAVLFILPVYVPAMMGIAIILALAVLYGAYWLLTSRNLEYEYAITNGDITVDKIIARRKRKRVVVLDAKNVDEMGKYRASDHEQKQYTTRMDAARDIFAEDVWYMVFHHTAHGKVLLTFSPDERTLKAIKPFLPRQVAMEAFGRDAFSQRG
jgi:hypothetical protein